MEKKNQVLMTVLGVFALVIVTVGVTYAFFTYTRTGTTESTIKASTGEISFVYTNDETGVVLENAVPMTTDAGKALVDTYDFSIAATMTTNATINYTVTAVNTTGVPQDGKKALENKDVRAYLTKVAGGSETALWETTDQTKLMSEVITNGTEGTLYNGTLTTTTEAASQSEKFKLRIWIDKDWDSSLDLGNTDIQAGDNGTGTIQEGSDYTVDENGNKVTANTTERIYSLKVKVTANAVKTS